MWIDIFPKKISKYPTAMKRCLVSLMREIQSHSKRTSILFKVSIIKKIKDSKCWWGKVVALLLRIQINIPIMQKIIEVPQNMIQQILKSVSWWDIDTLCSLEYQPGHSNQGSAEEWVGKENVLHTYSGYY